MGKLKRGLYYLQNDEGPTKEMTMTGQKSKELTSGEEKKAEKTTVESEYIIWHQRLGHVPLSKLQHIDRVKQCLSQQRKQVCRTFPMSRMNKLTFPTSNSHALKPFDLIQTDIWEPYKVPTRGKFRSFLTLVDDHSRMTWVYLLEKRSDYLSTLLRFKEYVVTQFDGKLKVIRSDNALEFVLQRILC